MFAGISTQRMIALQLVKIIWREPQGKFSKFLDIQEICFFDNEAATNIAEQGLTTMVRRTEQLTLHLAWLYTLLLAAMRSVSL